MTPQDLAKWVREENEKVTVLISALRERVALAPPARGSAWLKEFRERFEHLRAHLVRHMALEEKAPGGYLACVLELRPTLAPQVDRLKHNHEEMRRLMDVLHRQIELVRPDDRLFLRDTMSRICDFLGYLEQHHEQETLIMTYAFTQELGVQA
ncbi:MAG TPA: hemerythrin domain-containing protein [Phycisphaerae bacterium]|nr:hemerythrin domain-containing protein [Phycisphaerae bacterium]HNU46822.1 hemerythrin domain-containing protein [Phycisphaerae bacterium]